MGRRAEMGRLRSSIVRTVSRTPSVLEPDFAYAEPPRRRDTAPCREALIQRPSENAENIPDVTKRRRDFVSVAVSQI